MGSIFQPWSDSSATDLPFKACAFQPVRSLPLKRRCDALAAGSKTSFLTEGEGWDEPSALPISETELRSDSRRKPVVADASTTNPAATSPSASLGRRAGA